MNRKALFCDGTSSYVIPAEPENQKIVLRFRTAKRKTRLRRLPCCRKRRNTNGKRLPVGYLIIMRQRGS